MGELTEIASPDRAAISMDTAAAGCFAVDKSRWAAVHCLLTRAPVSHQANSGLAAAPPALRIESAPCC